MRGGKVNGDIIQIINFMKVSNAALIMGSFLEFGGLVIRMRSRTSKFKTCSTR